MKIKNIIYYLVALTTSATISAATSYLPVQEVPATLFPQTFKQFKLDFADGLIPSRPLLFKAAASDWGAIEDLSLSNLQANYGDVYTQMYMSWNQALLDTQKTKDQSISQHIHEIFENPKQAGYLHSAYSDAFNNYILNETMCNASYSESITRNDDFKSDFLLANPELLNHAEFPPIDASIESWAGYVLFVGPKNTRTKFHKHIPVFLAQIQGSKTIYLISSTAWHQHLCTYLDHRGKPVSDIDPENPDLSACPQYNSVEVHKVVVHPGDIVYIPRDWYHYVVANEPSSTLSFFFKFSNESSD